MKKIKGRFEETSDGIDFAMLIEKLNQMKNGTTVEARISQIDLSYNIRLDEIDPAGKDIQELKESIRERGLIQNPTITTKDNKIVCLTGHRRIIACKELGLETVRCTLLHVNSDELFNKIQFDENIARKNLSTLDVAAFLSNLRRSKQVTQTEMETYLSFDRKKIGFNNNVL